jgi:hypothetical protein
VGGVAEPLAQRPVADEPLHLGCQLGAVLGEQARAAVLDRLGQPADGQRRARRAVHRRLHHGQAPALGGGGREVHPRARQQLSLERLAHVPVQHDPVGEPARGDLGLERLAVVAVAGDVQHRLGDRLEHVEEQLDPLVLLEPAEVEQPRRRRALGGRERRGLDAEVGDVDAVGGQPELEEVVAPGL